MVNWLVGIGFVLLLIILANTSPHWKDAPSTTNAGPYEQQEYDGGYTWEETHDSIHNER